MWYVLPIIAFTAFLLVLLGFWKLFRFLVATWESDGANRPIKRAGVPIVVCGLIAIPFVGRFLAEAALISERIPAPLHVSKVEFKAEVSWGFGPGGNETGFVVYKLKPKSIQWLRDHGQTIGANLPGVHEVWLQTPILASEANEPWFVSDTDTETMTKHPTITNYLNRYGFSISIDAEMENDFNQSLRKAGSWYRYGGGGSVTVVDPTLGRVYFAYSG